MRVGIPLGGWLMKLPWVSREAYEASEARVETAERRYADLLSRYDTALDKMIHPPQPVTASLVIPSKPVDPFEAEITKLIREQAGGNVSLGAHLRRYAKSLKDAGDTPDQIIGKLVAWTTTEDE